MSRCLVLCSESMQRRDLSYVQASRAREETRFYVDRSSAGPNLDRLVQRMERRDEHYMAMDLVLRVA